jgi:hypothetical protein
MVREFHLDLFAVENHIGADGECVISRTTSGGVNMEVPPFLHTSKKIVDTDFVPVV